MKSYLKVDPIFRNGYKDKARQEAIHNIPCSLCILLNEKQTTRTTMHHRHGHGAGKKTSDMLAISLCDSHHQSGPKAFHKLNRESWEKEFNTTQEDLLEITNKLLEYHE
jgi:hypothetical protein